MAIFRVQAPDGSILRIQAPDNATDTQVQEFAAQQFKPGKSWDEKVQFERGKLQEQQLSEMPWYERIRAGLGKSLKDTATGIGQIAGVVPQSTVDEERKLSQPLMDDPAGIAGNIAGSLAQAVAIPGGNTLRGATAINAALAGAQPVATGESRGMNAAIGGGLGAAGNVGAQVVGKVARGPATVLTPTEQSLVAKAQAHGIDLTPAQTTGNKFLQTVDAVMEKLPATAASQVEKKAEQATQFTRAVTRQFGAEADNIGEGTMAGAKARLGSNYREIFDNVQIPVEDFAPRLALIRDEAERVLPADRARGVLAQLDDLVAKAKDGAIDGLQYQKWRSNLKAEGEAKHFIKLAKTAVDDAAAAALGPEKVAKYAKTNLEYKNMKTVEPLAEKSTSGNVPPALLLERVRSANPGMAYSGAGEMGDLAKMGKALIKDQVPDSGTAQRALAQSLLTGGAGLGGFAASGDPMVGLKTGLGTLGATVALPKMVQALLNKPGMLKYLAEGGVKEGAVDPRLIELLMRGTPALPGAAYTAGRQ